MLAGTVFEYFSLADEDRAGRLGHVAILNSLVQFVFTITFQFMIVTFSQKFCVLESLLAEYEFEAKQ